MTGLRRLSATTFRDEPKHVGFIEELGDKIENAPSTKWRHWFKFFLFIQFCFLTFLFTTIAVVELALKLF